MQQFTPPDERIDENVAIGASPVTIDLVVTRASAWTLAIQNTGANAVTSASVELIPNANVPSVAAVDAAASAAVLAALAPAGVASLDGGATAYDMVRVTLTSAAGTTVTVARSTMGQP